MKAIACALALFVFGCTSSSPGPAVTQPPLKSNATGQLRPFISDAATGRGPLRLHPLDPLTLQAIPGITPFAIDCCPLVSGDGSTWSGAWRRIH